MQHKFTIKALLIGLSFLFAFATTGFAQTLGGPTCVQYNQENMYYIQNSDPDGYYEWTISGGESVNGNTFESGNGLYYLLVKFYSSGSITVYTPNGGAYVQVFIASTLSSGSITSNATQTINYGLTPGTIGCSLPSGGGCSPIYNFQWQSSTDGTNWSDISGQTAQTLSFGSGLTQTSYFRRKVTETSSGSVGYSDIATVNVNPPLNANTLSPSAQNIFVGDNAGAIAGNTASGGSGGYSYQWQSSSNNSTWSDISGATAQGYSPGAVTSTTYYRRKVTSGSETAYTPSVVVNVYQHLSAGSISATTSCILSNTSPGQFTGTAASGGMASYDYQWQSSADNSTWNDISGATGQNHTPGNLTTTTYFRRKVSSASEVQYSNTSLITVYNALVSGVITGGATPIVAGSSPGPLTVGVASGGACSGTYSYVWEISSDGTNFVPMGISGLTYTHPGLYQTSHFRVKVSINGVSAYSNVKTITVYSALTAGTITSESFEVQYNTTPQNINATVSSGGSCGSYNYQWERSADNNTFETIQGATTQNYSFSGGITQSFYYRRKTTCNSDIAYTNSIKVSIICNSGTITCSQAIDPGGSVTAFTLSNSGGGSVMSYQWESSPDELNWTTISGANSTSYTPLSPSITTYYRVKVGCDANSAYSNSVRIKVKGSVTTNTPNSSTATSTQMAVAMPSYPSGTDGNNQNYLRTRTFTKSGIMDLATANAVTSLNDVSQVTEYVDGLGRPIQSVAKGVTPSGHDMVSTTWYDQFGIVTKKYLPYTDNQATGNFRMDPTTQQASFYNGYFNNTENFYYSNLIIENSPLNRVLKETAPGKSWTGSNRGIRIKQRANRFEEDVKIWSISLTQGAVPQMAGSYDNGKLFVTEITDESENKVIEYKDKQGQVILKKVMGSDVYCESYSGWLSTYYIYDDFGRLRWVLQPKAVEWLLSNSWNLASNTNLQNELCFRSEYDERGRLTLKKVPGAAELYMVYDKRDRLVYTQDGNMRGKNQWMVTMYDALNRPTVTGIMTYTGQLSDLVTHAGNQDFTSSSNVSVQSSAHLTIPSRETGRQQYQAPGSIEFTAGFESETSAEFTAEIVSASSLATTEYVPGNPFPSGANFTTLTLSYYEDYSKATQKPFDAAAIGKLTHDNSPNWEQTPSSPSQKTRGVPTVGKVWTLEDPADLTKGRWLETVSYYDDKGRMIQVQADNIAGGKEVVSSMYDFSGKALCTYQSHSNPGSNTAGAIRIRNIMKYDAAGRLLTITKQLNDNDNLTTTIVQNEYDALGQLKKKKLAPGYNSNQGLETLDYAYNIRGWLSSVNKDFAINSGANANNRYFGMELSYNYGFGRNQFNGNIGGIRWRSKGDGEQRAYGFDYDNVNRFKKADFTQNNGAWNTSAGIDFSVENLTYDANGNIRTMWQKGWKVTGSDYIDKLNYDYRIGGTGDELRNKLFKVGDDINSAQTKLGDFKDGSNTNSNDYSYDVNGNLVLDHNKSISSIAYNYLNLPQKLVVKNDNGTDKGTIEYVYDAGGNKLKKIVKEAGNTTTTTYIGGIVYESKNTSGDVLQSLSMEEGRLRPKDDANTPFVYDYFIKDYLGNVRMVLTDEVKVDPYETLTFEDENINEQNALWENKQGQSINVAAVRSQVTMNTGDTKAMLVKKSMGAIGATKFLKVMAGDKIHTKVDYFYTAINSNNSGADPLTNIVTSLIGSFTNTSAPAALLKDQATNITNQLSANNSFLSFINPAANTSGGNSAPKAYLCVLFFNDQFKFDQASSVIVPVAYAPNQRITIDKSFSNAIPVQKSGYAYIYFTNESEETVFFDNFHLSHERGPILEETHYYPFGLTMAGISSKAINNGSPENKKKFVEQELDSELEVNWYQFKYRNHDPQIGRFIQIDPVSSFYTHNSTYAYAENKVITGIDAEGLEYVTRIHTQNVNGTWTTKDIEYYKMSERQIKQERGTPSDWYEAASYGPEGKGVMHIFRYSNGESEITWDNQRKDFESKAGNHGLYSGPGSITDLNRRDDFSFQPIDWADAIAKRHDMDYAAATENGEPYGGYKEDIRTYQADVDMIKRVDDLLSDQLSFSPNQVSGVETPFRRGSSGEMLVALVGQKKAISALAAYKKWKMDKGYKTSDTFKDIGAKFALDDPINAAIVAVL